MEIEMINSVKMLRSFQKTFKIYSFTILCLYKFYSLFLGYPLLIPMLGIFQNPG